MFGDLDKTIDLINTKRAAPNFLLALVICCYIEYWGRLVNGIANDNSEKCFNEFFDRLGSCYQKQRRQSSCDIYKDIRCSLVHSYVINKSAKIKFRGGKCGVVFDQFTKEYNIYIERYYRDFKNAVDRYISELENGSGLDKMEKAPKGQIYTCVMLNNALQCNIRGNSNHIPCTTVHSKS